MAHVDFTQVGGQNYLVPVDAKLAKERDLRYEAVSLADVFFETEWTSGINVIVLDACRNNPLARSLARRMGRTRAALVGRGLARVEGAVGRVAAPVAGFERGGALARLNSLLAAA